MSLTNLSIDELHEARLELDNRIRELRERKLEIAREIESRYPETEPAGSQVVAPGFIESEAEVVSPADPPRKRWFKA